VSSRQQGMNRGRSGQTASVDEEWARFGRRVGELREEAGLSYGDLVMREVCSAEEVRRIEVGEKAPPRHLAEYLDSRLNAHGSLTNAWARALLNAHLVSGAPPHELDFSAGTLREFHPGAVPPQLQTQAYAAALGRVQGKPGNRPAGRNRAASLRVVINESAVRTAVGGADVMRSQLDDLITCARGQRVCLQIVPVDVSEHPCSMGPFRLLTLGPVYTVAHLLSPIGDGQLITRPDHVRAFTDLFEDLRGVALPINESLDLLVHLAESLEPVQERQAITSGEEGRVLSSLSSHRATL